MAQKGGRKLTRSGKKRGYYERQYAVTERNKARRASRRQRRKLMWQVKKEEQNG